MVEGRPIEYRIRRILLYGSMIIVNTCGMMFAYAATLLLVEQSNNGFFTVFKISWQAFIGLPQSTMVIFIISSCVIHMCLPTVIVINREQVE